MQSSRVQKLLDFLQNEPNDPFLKYALATEYLNMNDLSRALEYYEALVINHPDYLGTYYHLGKLYERLDRKDDALETFQSGIEVARSARDNHALSELQAAYNAAAGLDYDDD